MSEQKLSKNVGKNIENNGKSWRNNLENTILDIVLYQYFPIIFCSIFQYFTVFFGIFRFVWTVFTGILIFGWKISFYGIFRYLPIIGILEKYRKPVFQIMKKYRNVLGVIVEKYWKKYCKIHNIIPVFFSQNQNFWRYFPEFWRYFSTFLAAFFRIFFSTEKYSKYWKIPGSIFRQIPRNIRNIFGISRYLLIIAEKYRN